MDSSTFSGVKESTWAAHLLVLSSFFSFFSFWYTELVIVMLAPDCTLLMFKIIASFDLFHFDYTTRTLKLLKKRAILENIFQTSAR